MVVIPAIQTKTDWEVELALVIGKKASHVERNKALDMLPAIACTMISASGNFELEQ